MWESRTLMACMSMQKDFTLTDIARPLGTELPNWTAAALPYGLVLAGRRVVLRPIDALRDAAGLWAQFQGHDWVWDYLSEPVPANFDAFQAVIRANADRVAQPCYAICDAAGEAPLGYACFWTVAANMGSAEIGNVNLSPAAQQTPAATEAFFLMLDWAFSHGYRRMEWKCNALNAPSRRAAQRLGFSFEGIFRNHYVIKGRSRDTAWFAMTDTDWADLRPQFVAWLSSTNFDDKGRQRQSLLQMTEPYLIHKDPA